MEFKLNELTVFQYEGNKAYAYALTDFTNEKSIILSLQNIQGCKQILWDYENNTKIDDLEYSYTGGVMIMHNKCVMNHNSLIDTPDGGEEKIYWVIIKKSEQ